MSGTTDRLGLGTPALSDEPNIEVPIETALETLDGIVVVYTTGPDAEKGAAGTVGRIHWADDTRRLYFDTGAEWRLVNAAGAAGGALNGTYPNPSIAAGAIGTSQIAPGAVTLTRLAADAISLGPMDVTTLRLLSERTVYDPGGGDLGQIPASNTYFEMGEVAGTIQDRRLPAVLGLTIQSRLVATLRTANSTGGSTNVAIRTPDALLVAQTGTTAAVDGYPKIDSGWQNVNPNIDGFFQAINSPAASAWDVWLQSLTVLQRYSR